MNILITILARGNSKGVKDKNIRKLAGKPLIAYSIETAKKWGKAKRIVCSTDSEKIAKIAKKYGAEIPFTRPIELSTDTSGKISAIRHALIKSEEIYNEQYDLIIDLDVTNPFRNEKDLENCLRLFTQKRPEIIFSVVKARKNPYFNMVKRNEKGFAELVCKSKKPVLRRQDALKVYDMNASIYFYSRSFLINESNKSVFSTKRVMIYEMAEESSLDIDRDIDFKFIEFLIENGAISIK